MKKTLLFIAFTYLVGFSTFSQRSRLAVGLSSTHDFYFQSPLANRNMYGLKFQYFMSERLSINNRLLFGINQANDKLMIHYGFGGLLTQATLQNGIVFWSGNLIQDLTALVFLPIIIPEGVQFHFGSDNLKISPYIYPASFEYNVLNDQEIKALLEIGVQFRFIQKDKYFIAPNIAWKMRYGDSRQAFSVGFMIGILND
jgi:hypothetical protein